MDGAAAVLVEVERLLADLADGAVAGGIHILVDQAAHLRVVVLRGERQDDVHRALQVADEREGFRRERVFPGLGEIEAPGMVLRDIVQPPEERQEEHGLQEQVQRAEPADGAKTLER